MAMSSLADRGTGVEAGSYVRDAAIVAFVVFAAAMFGILTRPMGFLAAFWPANAILLGMFVRWPTLATVPNWLAAFGAYMAADLVTGGTLFVTMWLTVANIVGALVGYLLFQFVSDEDRRLQRPLSVLALLGICVAAAAAAAAAGGGAARILFDRNILTGFEFWFTTELVNSLVILPVMLTFPERLSGSVRVPSTVGQKLWMIAPAVALSLSAGISVAIGGPGAIAFTVPALIWCALTYQPFTTAILTALLCAGLLIATSSGILPLPMSSDLIDSTNSIRLAVALIAIAPLTVSAVNQAREQLVRRLAHAADHDSLTGVLSRRAFMDRGYGIVSKLSGQGVPCALLMLDLDHFKRVNDTHGHAGGDRVLVEFARLVSGELREQDIFGRLGGEEFAVMLPLAGLKEAAVVAERIRAAIASAPVELESGRMVDMSVSIGVSVIDGITGACLDKLMARSDDALYGAKAEGRNRVRLAA